VTALSDALAIVAFATVGLLSHRHALSASGYAEDALPLLGGWFAAGALFRLYRGGGRTALVATWAVGVPVGVVVRALVLGHAVSVAFLVVSLVFVGLFVAGLRLALGSRGALRRAA
jgi:hypothetical protein